VKGPLADGPTRGTGANERKGVTSAMTPQGRGSGSPAPLGV